MNDLFKAELLRFRTWALVAALVHAGVLGFLSRLVDLAQQPRQIYQIFAAVYVIAGLLLGLYQMGTYRRPNHWLNLLHRPMHRLRIAAALCGAGAAVLLVAVALPIALTALYQDTLTARVVDVRHWLMPLAGLLVALCGYLAGAYAMLANRRHSSAVLVLPLLLAYSQAHGPAALAVQAVVLLFLAVLVAIAFKPDLSATPRNPLAVLATALPVMTAASVLLYVLGFGVEMGWTLAGSHPLNMPQPPAGGHIEADRFEGKDMLLAGIEGSREADAPLWREQIALSDVVTLYPLRELPRRGELANIAPMELQDSEHGVLWVFSHDRMRFVGRGLLDQRPRGELGAGQAQAPFPAPTMEFMGGFLFNAHAAYQFDAEQQRIFERVRLPEGEVMASPPQRAGDDIVVLSNRAAYFFPGREAANTLDLLRPRLRVPMPGPAGQLGRADLVELLDGYLVSYTYTWGVWDGTLSKPYQAVVRVDGDGTVHPVARRDLAHDLPIAYDTRAWWLSPPLRALSLGAQALFAAPDPLRAAPDAMPRQAVVIAAVLGLLSLLAAIWLTARQRLTGATRWGWVAASGLVGVPALASLWLLYRPRERVDALPRAQSAAA